MRPHVEGIKSEAIPSFTFPKRHNFLFISHFHFHFHFPPDPERDNTNRVIYHVRSRASWRHGFSG
jgi:hypothetical protein